MKIRRTVVTAILLCCIASAASAQEVRIEGRTFERARAFEQSFAAAAAKHGIDARLLWVIAYLESRFNPHVVSRKGARGMMQLLPATAARFGVGDPHDPAESIEAAARYVRYLLGRFEGRADLALAAYNAGEATVDAYRTGRTVQAGGKIINPARLMTGGIPPYRETQKYVREGLSLLTLSVQSLSVVSPSPSGKPAHGSSDFSAATESTDNQSPQPSTAQLPKGAVRLSISYFHR